MGKLESLEKLHDITIDNDVLNYKLQDALDYVASEIQAEVNSRFIELPVDVENIPIKPGDRVRGFNGENADARFITIHCDGTYEVGSRGWQPRYLEHIKKRTVEDVLEEFASRVLNSGHQWGLDCNATIEKYAAELQMRGDA